MTAVFQSAFSIRSILSNTSSYIEDVDMDISSEESDDNLDSSGNVEITTPQTPPPSAAQVSPPLTPPSSEDTNSDGARSPDAEQLLPPKPCLTYSSLIFLAIRNSPEKRLPLSGICDWISQHFPYFALNKPSWQNSVRHNLSLNTMFVRIPRPIDDPGRGQYWTIDPAYSDMEIGESTGRLRRSNQLPNRLGFGAAPLPKTMNMLQHHTSTGQVHSYMPSLNSTTMGIPHFLDPRAVYFPRPEEQMAQAQQQAIIQQQLHQSAQAWSHFQHQLPTHILQQSMMENQHFQQMLATKPPSM